MINDNRFSVLAIPDSLSFYLNDEKECKQEIKIYNVHDFTINFKVFCTSVDNYSVNPPSGLIRSGCMINVTIELKNHDFDRKKDVFKINAHSKENDKITGEKEIIARILLDKPSDEDAKLTDEVLEATKCNESLINSYKGNRKPSTTTITLDNPRNLVIISTGRFCLYIILVFILGIFAGIILNAPQDIRTD